MQNLYLLEKIYYRLEDQLQPTESLPPDSGRTITLLPAEGRKISVEKALNSRCSSDYDGNPRKFHWGVFDRTKKLSEDQISSIEDLVKIPRLTDGWIEIRFEQNLLTFLIDNHAVGIRKCGMMVESGMQQQAVGLVCSALGAGMTFYAQGRDGKEFSEDEYLIIKILLDALEPSYSGSYWCETTPSGRPSWLSGNLPDPVRDGKIPLLRTLADLSIKHNGSELITDNLLGQVLWAARGRTPHLYKTKPWGLTIPTWGGRQEISSIYVIAGNRLSEYVNWKNHRPTNSLSEINHFDHSLMNPLRNIFHHRDKFIVIGKNEDFYRAYWEVGYQMLNILLQSKALDISYEAALVDEDQKNILATIGITDSVAIVAFK